MKAVKHQVAAKPNSKRSTTAFNTAFASLNPQQRQAVETIEGPLMVIAGPGTGKTQVVALRVANILERTHARPSNILCLTFSNSGALAMRKRLTSLIGADAYGVTIDTIHGFCNTIIGQNPHVFDDWGALEQISDIEKYRQLNKVIDSLLPNLKLVNKKNPYRRTKEILGRISQVKREGKSTQDLLDAAAEYREIMESKSKPGTKIHERNLLQATKFEEFVEIFKLYTEMLINTGRYDYDDMILRVLKTLKEEDWLLAQLQERYQYILVDEFQDTNGAQYGVIERLTTYPNLEDEPNLCIVGDDDQAIYRFQGANLHNIMQFRSRFKDSKIIVLTQSYRCSQAILNTASNIINHNTERLVGTIEGLSKDLTSAQGIDGGDPKAVLVPSDASEPWVIADMLEKWHADGTHYAEVAVLTQTNSELLHLYDVLSARNIPVQMNGKVDLLAQDIVRQTISILKAIVGLHDNAALAAALSCACFSCHSADLGRLFAASRHLEKPIADVLLTLEEDEQIPFYNKLALLSARDTLLHLSQQIENKTILSLLESLLKETGLLKTGEEMDLIEFSALQALFNVVKYRAYEQPHFEIKHLLADIDMYDTPEYGDVRLTYTSPHLTDEGVHLMTAHQSKGLEFEKVILSNFREGHWDKRRNPSSLSIPEDILFGWGKDQKGFEQGQDERRLSYVSITRAKSELVAVLPLQKTTGDTVRDTAPSAFLAEAGTFEESNQEPADPNEASTLLLTPVRTMDEELQSFLKECIQHFSLSVTALNHFLEDPQLFVELDLLKMPRSKTPSLIYGNAVHYALKKWGMSLQEGMPLSQSGFTDAFTQYLEEREILTNKEKEALLATGKEALPRYHANLLEGAPSYIHKVEYPVHARVDDVPIKGMIDRIDLPHPESALATITDYKTGRPQTEKQIKDGDYYRQLVFYALLIEHSPSGLTAERFVLDFVGEEENHPIKRIFTVSEEDKKELRALIKTVWSKIELLDFTPIE